MAQEMNNPGIDPETLSPLSLAFLGDSIYESIIRSRVLKEYGGNLTKAAHAAKSLTNAKAQNQIIMAIMEHLSPREISVYKRGRNAKSVSAPKSCTISQYRHATGLEALVGYLFLNGEKNRLLDLLNTGIESIS